MDDNLNNSDEEDDLLLADSYSNNTMDLFDISYVIYSERWTKKKENIMKLQTLIVIYYQKYKLSFIKNSNYILFIKLAK